MTMSDEPENLVLEHLKVIRSELAALRDDLRELRDRQVETHTAVLAVRRDQIHDAETGANLAARVDRLADRLERIERRLDLSDNPAE